MRNWLYTVLLILLCGCSVLPDNEEERTFPPVHEEESPYVEGIFRIKLREPLELTSTKGDIPSAPLKSAMAKAGAYSVRRAFSDGGRFRERRQKAGLDRWYNVYIDNSTDIIEAMEMFGCPEEVECMEPVHRMKLVKNEAAAGMSGLSGEIPFNDPGAKYQWYLYNRFNAASCYSSEAHFNIQNAWSVETGSRDVIVAVMDGGVDYSHPDMKDAMWDDGNGHCGHNFITDNNDITPSDHGTGVAAIIGAVNGNSEGMCGIAGGNGAGGVRIMSCQVFGEGGHSPDIGEFMAYAADNGAVICNNSWNYTGLSDLSQYGKDAIDYFIRNAGMDENGNQTGPMAGGIVIFSAGNDNVDTPPYPSAYGPIISVASLNADFRKAETSNYGDWVDIAAFGGAPGVYTAGTGGAYGFVMGTSVAAPQIAGLAALAVSYRGGPGFTADDLKRLLLDSGRKDRMDEANPEYIGKLGSGIPDAEYIMFYGAAPGKAKEVSAHGKRHHIELEWTVPECYASLPVCEYDVFVSKSSLEGLDPEAPGEDVMTYHFSFPEAVTGGKARALLTGLEKMCGYEIAIVSRTRFGMYSDPVLIHSALVENTAPELTSPIDNITFNGLGKDNRVCIDLSSHFTDMDMPEDRLICFTDASVQGIVSCMADADKLYITPEAAGTTTLTILVADRDGAAAQTEIKITVIGDLSVYPNPFDKYFNIRIPGHEGELAVTLYDRTGRAVLDSKVNVTEGLARIGTPSVAPGTYRMVAKTDGRVIEKQVVKR